MSRFTIERRNVRRDAPPAQKYTQGFCGEFAMALHLLGCGTLVVVCDGEYLIHAMVRTSRGLFMDVTGTHTWGTVSDRWTVHRWAGISWRKLTRDWCLEPAEVRIALDYVRAHATTYGVTLPPP